MQTCVGPLSQNWMHGKPTEQGLMPSPVFASLAGAALVVALAVGLTFRGSTGAPEIPLVTEPEIAIVQDMELLEDLEFLAWLEEELQGAG